MDPNVCSCIDKTKNVNAYGECDTVNFVPTPAPAVTTPAVTTPAPTTPAVTNPAVTTPSNTTPAGKNPDFECDVCAKLLDIEAQNKEIIALLKQ